MYLNLLTSIRFLENLRTSTKKGTYDDFVHAADLTKESKVLGRTAIPAGTYRITMTYSPKFKRVMPLVNGVPQFEAIRIHLGNKAEYTEGCILVGENTVIGGLTNSRKWSDELNKRIQDTLVHKEDVLITINN